MDKSIPFRFVGKLAGRNTRLINYAISGNEIMLCIEAGLNLIDMAENITKYYYEAHNTKEIENQIYYEKSVIEMSIEVENETSKVILSKTKLMIENELKKNKHRLEKDLRILKSKLETRALHTQLENELFLKKWDFISEIRKALNSTLAIIARIIEDNQKNDINQDALIILNEEYRETQFRYNKLIKQLA